MGGGGDSWEKNKVGPAAQAHYYINIAEGSRASWSYSRSPKSDSDYFLGLSPVRITVSLPLSHIAHRFSLYLSLSLSDHAFWGHTS